MTRSQKILLVAGIIFLIILGFIVWDFSRQTKFRKFGETEPPAQEERSEGVR